MRLTFLLFLLLKPDFGQVADVKKDQTDRCVALLKKVLREQPEWIKVHAAEYLLWAGYPEGVKEVFLKENGLHWSQSPYRIGIWRILAQASVSQKEKDFWIDKIKKAFLDSNGPDRLHAAETLAKLKISPFLDDPELTAKTLESPIRPLAIYTLWSVAFTLGQRFEDSKTKLLALAIDPSENENTSQSLAAYTLRHLGKLSISDWGKLAKAALVEPENSVAKINLLSSAFAIYPKEKTTDKQLALIHDQLLKYKNAKQKGQRIEMAMALAARGTDADLPVLMSLLKNENSIGNAADGADVMAAAAYAILRIEKSSINPKSER